jgi:gluconolactonase
MPTANDLPEVLETTEPERLATGFIFTEGPLWHPDSYWYFVDLRRNQLLRLTPGKEPELVRTTIGGNGTTFDLLGRLIVCEGDDRRLTRMRLDGKVESLVDNYKGGRFNRPNDVVCHSNGCLYFTDPDKRRPYQEREIPGPAGEDNLWDGARVYRLAPDGGLSVLANCEYPNGLALSPDERTMYVANTRSSQYIHAIRLDAAGNMVGRSIFADLNEGSEPGIPDGLKVDSIGRVYCTGRAASGSWRRTAGASASSGGRSRPSTSRSAGRTCGRCSVARTLRSTRCASRCPATRIPGTSGAGSNLTTPAAAASRAGRRRCRAPAPPRARSQAPALPHWRVRSTGARPACRRGRVRPAA